MYDKADRMLWEFEKQGVYGKVGMLVKGIN